MEEQSVTYNEQPSRGYPQRLRTAKRKASFREKLMRTFGVRAQEKPISDIVLPKWFAGVGIITYAAALLLIHILYFEFATEWYFVLFGLGWVVGFFVLAQRFSNAWSFRAVPSPRRFEQELFWTAFLIRVVYVVFIYFFYTEMAGQPFEFQAADAVGYTEVAQDWALYLEQDRLWEMLVKAAQKGVSDMGFPFLMFPLFYIFGVDAGIIVLRVCNALVGAYMAVVVYRLASRSMGESTSRLAGIFCVLHPVLICYAGMSLKEVIMTCLVALFIERSDNLLRNRHYSVGTILPVALLGLSLFFFRTVLGMIAFIALLFSLLMMDTKIVSSGRKVVIGGVIGVLLLLMVSDRILQEVNKVRESDAMGQQRISMQARYGAGKRGGNGNSLAQYAGAAVFAPLIFTIPFPTAIIVEGQEDMRLIHGGNWVRNVISGLVILAMVILLLTGDWRNFTLPLAMLLGYLVMLVFTEFAHSLRFHIPIIPFEMMFAAYAFTRLGYRRRSWYVYWCVFMIVTFVAWNWFKLAGRGLV